MRSPKPQDSKSSPNGIRSREAESKPEGEIITFIFGPWDMSIDTSYQRWPCFRRNGGLLGGKVEQKDTRQRSPRPQSRRLSSESGSPSSMLTEPSERKWRSGRKQRRRRSSQRREQAQAVTCLASAKLAELSIRLEGREGERRSLRVSSTPQIGTELTSARLAELSTHIKYHEGSRTGLRVSSNAQSMNSINLRLSTTEKPLLNGVTTTSEWEEYPVRSVTLPMPLPDPRLKGRRGRTMTAHCRSPRQPASQNPRTPRLGDMERSFPEGLRSPERFLVQRKPFPRRATSPNSFPERVTSQYPQIPRLRDMERSFPEEFEPPKRLMAPAMPLHRRSTSPNPSRRLASSPAMPTVVPVRRDISHERRLGDMARTWLEGYAPEGSMLSRI